MTDLRAFRTVRLDRRFRGWPWDDLAGLTNQNGIAGSYGPATGVLTLPGQRRPVATIQPDLDVQSTPQAFDYHGRAVAGADQTAQSTDYQ